MHRGAAVKGGVPRGRSASTLLRKTCTRTRVPSPAVPGVGQCPRATAGARQLGIGDAMAISSEDFRNALSHFAAGVTITTIRAGEHIHGLTVSAFASVSADPPLI